MPSDDPVTPGTSDPASSAAAPEGIVRVTEDDPDGFRQAISAGPHHRMVADEPVSFGGTDTGPSPYQFLAAGLGACTAMTIRMYARRKDWPLAHVAVDVRHGQMHGRDCADCPDKTVRIDLFRRVIRLDGPLDADQRTRLLEIADRCPVHRTLEGTIRIHTVLDGA